MIMNMIVTPISPMSLKRGNNEWQFYVSVATNAKRDDRRLEIIFFRSYPGIKC